MPAFIVHGLIGYMLYDIKGFIYGMLPDIIGFGYYFFIRKYVLSKLVINTFCIFCISFSNLANKKNW